MIFFLQIVIFLRGMCIVLMVLFNALMWTTFVKSLQKCSSTIQATVTNSAANFFFSVSLIYQGLMGRMHANIFIGEYYSVTTRGVKFLLTLLMLTLSLCATSNTE